MKAPTSFQTESQQESCNRVHGFSRTSFAVFALKGPGRRLIWRGTVTPKLGSEEDFRNMTLWWYNIVAVSYAIGAL